MSQKRQVEEVAAWARELRLRRLRVGSVEVEPLYDDDGLDNDSLENLFDAVVPGGANGQAAE